MAVLLDFGLWHHWQTRAQYWLARHCFTRALSWGWRFKDTVVIRKAAILLLRRAVTVMDTLGVEPLDTNDLIFLSECREFEATVKSFMKGRKAQTPMEEETAEKELGRIVELQHLTLLVSYPPATRM